MYERRSAMMGANLSRSTMMSMRFRGVLSSRCKVAVGVYARPPPVPLPRERENRLAAPKRDHPFGEGERAQKKRDGPSGEVDNAYRAHHLSTFQYSLPH